MQYPKLLTALVALGVWLSGAVPAEAARSRKASSTKKTASATRAKSGTKKKAARSGSARGRRTASDARRRSGPPRQQQPTPERFTEIQQALADKGYYTGPVDGAWNSECVDALKRFQADQNLSPDGKLGSLSLIALGLGPKRDPLPQQFLSKPESSNSTN